MQKQYRMYVMCAIAGSWLLSNSSFSEPAQSGVGTASLARPSARQLAWQQHEIEALIHFGINTFTGKEWGGGKESPKIFNPSDVNATQWVEAAKSFGAKAVIFTCKHHDGFCLWPTATTEFSVKNSPWRGGKGDLVRKVANACREAGVAFGLYLSPADMHEPSYGWKSAEYNDFFCAQLRELLTNYGEICQVFFDGAEPGYRQQKFDWQRFYALVRQLQPNAVISIRGPDVRWVGNERGIARESEWSVVPIPRQPDRYDWRDMIAPDLGSSKRLINANHVVWYPAVADVSLRRTWFWAPNTDDSIKSLEQLVRIYEKSVGRNAVLQLNISPDRTGKIPAADVLRLKEFGDALRGLFSKNLCAEPGVSARAEPNGGALKQVIDFPSPIPVRYVILQEDITKGQQVESAEVKLIRANGQEVVRSVSAIGWKRILKIETPDVLGIELTVKESRSAPHVTLSAY
jgi:alpha-L-fucosidase